MTKANQNIGFNSEEPLLVGVTWRASITLDEGSLSGSPTIKWRMTDISPTEGTPTTLIEKTLAGGGIEIIDVANRIIRITSDPVDTSALQPGDYYQEAQLIEDGGDTSSTTTGSVRLTGSAYV